MGFRPEFDETVRRSGGTLTVVGRTGDDPPPAGIQVFLEQGASVVSGAAAQPLKATWRADLPADGFGPGPALAFGVETRTRPFQAITWSETVTIE